MRCRKTVVTNACVLVLVFVLIAFPAFGQEATGTIQGIATDPSGASIPNATVAVSNTETGLTRTVTTGDDGAYKVPALPVGRYTVKVEKAGFQTETQQGLTLEVTQIAVVNFRLGVGISEQQVVVTAEASLVNTTSSALGGSVTAERMSDLPLNGRNYIDLTLLQPGVTKQVAQISSQGSAGTWFSSNGASPRSNNYMLDGAMLGNFLGGTSSDEAGATLGVDGIREYKVITNGFSAEYGMNMGSQVVMVSKAGTNQFHGDAFEYLRNSALDAANFFDRSLPINNFERLPPFRRNNFGASFGGPVKKDKTFFYAVYEGLRERTGITTVDNVFPTKCYSGSALILVNNPCAVSTANPGGNVAPGMVPLVSLYPHANLGTSQFSFPSVDPLGVNYGQIRVDQVVSTSDSFFGRFTIDRSNQSDTSQSNIGGSPAFPQFGEIRTGSIDNATLNEVHIFSPNLLSTARISFNRSVFFLSDSFPQGTSNLIGPNITFVPGQVVGQVNIGGVSQFGTTLTDPYPGILNDYSLSDDLIYTRGKHGLKFGVLLNRFNMGSAPHPYLKGRANFSSIANALAGFASQFAAGAPTNITSRNYFFNTYGFYAQDDWRVTSRLTLNLGLRYEFRNTPNETNGREYALRNPLTDSAFTQGPIFVNPSLKNLSPRIGLAWDVTGKGKTAVRATFGEYYDIANIGTSFFQQMVGEPPISVTSVHAPVAGQVITFPFTFAPSEVGAALHTVDYNAKQPHLLQYNLTVDQQLPGGVALSVSYVGMHGINLWTARDLNPVAPTSVINGVETWNSPAITAGCANSVIVPGLAPPAVAPCRVNPYFSTGNMNTTPADSHYNSLQVNLIKRLSHGFEFQSAYTWSQLLDDTEGQWFTGDCTSPGADEGVDPGNMRTDKGPACFDATQNWRFNLIYHFPKVSSEGLVSKLANGWWMGNIVSWQTGYPFSAVLGTQRSQSGMFAANFGDRPNVNTTASIAANPCTSLPGQPAAGANPCAYTPIPYDHNTVITGNPSQWFNPAMFSLGPVGNLGNAGRDILRGPHLGTWDFSLVKDTTVRALGEAGNVQFRAEFFNLMNHPNFSVPGSATVFSGSVGDKTPYSEAPSGGVGSITTTATTSRQIQFALKVIF